VFQQYTWLLTDHLACAPGSLAAARPPGRAPPRGQAHRRASCRQNRKAFPPLPQGQQAASCRGQRKTPAAAGLPAPAPNRRLGRRTSRISAPRGRLAVPLAVWGSDLVQGSVAGSSGWNSMTPDLGITALVDERSPSLSVIARSKPGESWLSIRSQAHNLGLY